jgi:hypothetical protein
MLIPLHHVPIKKMQFRNRAINLWSAGMMKCTRDFKNNRFGKAIVLCGKLFQGWIRSIGVKEESTQPVWDLQMHSIFLQSRFSLDSSWGSMGFICKTSWRKPSEELNSATSGVKSHHHCRELLYYVTLGCMGSKVHRNRGAGCLCKALICQSRSVDAHESVSLVDPCRPIVNTS